MLHRCFSYQQSPVSEDLSKSMVVSDSAMSDVVYSVALIRVARDGCQLIELAPEASSSISLLPKG